MGCESDQSPHKVSAVTQIYLWLLKVQMVFLGRQSGFAIITWNNPKKLEKTWITKGQYLAIFRVDFIILTVGANMVEIWQRFASSLVFAWQNNDLHNTWKGKSAWSLKHHLLNQPLDWCLVPWRGFCQAYPRNPIWRFQEWLGDLAFQGSTSKTDPTNYPYGLVKPATFQDLSVEIQNPQPSLRGDHPDT